LHQIDGYRANRSAILAKVHHCMVDGVSGVQLLGVMFDVTPDPPPPPPAPPAEAPPPLPTPSMQARRALVDGAAAAVEGARALGGRRRQPTGGWNEPYEPAGAFAEMMQMLLSPLPSTPFNGFVGTMRRIEWATLSLNDVKAVKNRLGGTVNDVILATISGAL